jgi:hypothetical protein
MEIPSGKRLHNYGKIHHFQWVNPLFLSISMVIFHDIPTFLYHWPWGKMAPMHPSSPSNRGKGGKCFLASHSRPGWHGGNNKLGKRMKKAQEGGG